MCEACNTGWMHELETTAEQLLAPLIAGQLTNTRGNPRRWREWRQSVAGTWATKTALMLEEISAHRAIPRNFAPLFGANLRPHSTQQIWIGHYTGAQPHGYYHGPLDAIDRTRPNEPPVAQGYAATIQVGHLVFRMFGLWMKDAPLILPQGDIARSLTQIHPLTPLAEWPPPLSIDDDGLHAITLALQAG